MNYLAHLVLAGPEPQSIVGNLVADFVKGSALDTLPPGIQQGVRMHRAIDRFTDAHALVRQSKARFAKRWTRVSGILVDVYYDHLLAKHWTEYSAAGLRQTLDAAYDAITDNLGWFSGETRAAAVRLIETDLIMSYTSRQGIEQALVRLSQRLRNGQFQLQESLSEFELIETMLLSDFRTFFPELTRFAAELNSARYTGI